MNKSLVCIGCPQGCRLKVNINNDKIEVNGYKCKKGLEYARQESVHPVRILTTTVLVEGRNRPLSVRTKNPIPKEIIIEAMNELARIKINHKVKIGDVIVHNIKGTGVDVIATENIM